MANPIVIHNECPTPSRLDIVIHKKIRGLVERLLGLSTVPDELVLYEALVLWPDLSNFNAELDDLILKSRHFYSLSNLIPNHRNTSHTNQRTSDHTI